MRLNLYMYVSEYIDKKIERLILGGGGIFVPTTTETDGYTRRYPSITLISWNISIGQSTCQARSYHTQPYSGLDKTHELLMCHAHSC